MSNLEECKTEVKKKKKNLKMTFYVFTHIIHQKHEKFKISQKYSYKQFVSKGF